MPRDWENARHKIHSLYIDEKKTLEEVQQLMKDNYGFKAW